MNRDIKSPGPEEGWGTDNWRGIDGLGVGASNLI